jgi:PleD family two-component response regulator
LKEYYRQARHAVFRFEVWVTRDAECCADPPPNNQSGLERLLMSSRLTLLFVCNERELYPVLTSALESANFHLVVARDKDQANGILKQVVVDAVLIQQGASRSGTSICAALKRQSPRTPILLFADENQQPEPYPGIYSILHADAHDELLTRAVAIFLRQSLDSSPDSYVAPPAGSSDSTAELSASQPGMLTGTDG